MIVISKSHIGSKLILKNKLLGMDKSLVAYFPFNNTVKDSISGIVPNVNSNTTLTSDGIAIEESTTNLLKSTCDMSNTSHWLREAFTGTITSNAAIAPDGTLTASHIDIRGGYIRQDITLSVSTTYTFSCWIKSANAETIINGGLCFWTYSGGSRVAIRSTETITKDWQRISLTYTTSPTETSFTMMVASAAIKLPYNVYVWGAQLEQKSFATSFIDGARGHGLFSFPSFNWNNSFTLLADTIVPSTVGYRMLGGGWSSWYFSWHNESSSTLLLSWVDGTQKTVTGTISGLDCREWNKIGFSYDSVNNIVKIYANGIVAGSGSANFSTLHPTHTAIGSISSGSNNYKLNGTVRNYAIYDRVLLDSEVSQLYINQDNLYNPNEEVTML